MKTYVFVNVQDVFHFHLVSQANLYAGTAWTIANLLKHRDWFETVIKELKDALKDSSGGKLFQQTIQT